MSASVSMNELPRRRESCLPTVDLPPPGMPTRAMQRPATLDSLKEYESQLTMIVLLWLYATPKSSVTVSVTV